MKETTSSRACFRVWPWRNFRYLPEADVATECLSRSRNNCVRQERSHAPFLPGNSAVCDPVMVDAVKDRLMI